MPRRVRIGVIGVGYISSAIHLPALAAAQDKFELVAIAELNEKIGREHADMYGAKYYRTHIEMMDNETLDAVDIVTGPLLHHRLVYDAARRGLAINVEKPVTLTLPLMDFMIKTVRENGVYFQVSENYPFMPWDIVITRMLDKGLLGRLESVWFRTPVNRFNFDIYVHHYTQLREVVRSEPTRVLAALQESAAAKLNHWKLQQPSQYGDVVNVSGSTFIDFQNGVHGGVEFFSFPYLGKNEDYYFAGDLRRVSGDKLMVTDNLWPVIHPGRDQKGEFHVYRINNEKITFEEVPVEVEYDSIGGRRVLSRITVRTDTPVSWELPKCLTSGPAIANNDHYGNNTIAWRSAMLELYNRFYEGVMADSVPDVDPAMRESIETMLALLVSQQRRRWVDLPLAEPTDFEKQFHDMYRQVTGEDIFDFVDSGSDSFVNRIYKDGQWVHPMLRGESPGQAEKDTFK